MAESRKISFTNNSDGPRGVNGINGVVMLEKGETAYVEVTEGEFNSAMSTGYFGDREDDDDGDKPLARMNKAELLAVADEEEVELEEGATNKQIIEAIEAKRAG